MTPTPSSRTIDHPAGPVLHLRQLVQVRVETSRIVLGLLPALAD